MLLFHIASLVGVFALATRICHSLLGNILYPVSSRLFLLSASWILSVGLRGVVGLWFYRLDQPVETAILFNGSIGFFGCFLFLLSWRKGNFKSDSSGFSFSSWSLAEKSVLGLILFGIGIYAYCAIAPWYEWDEIVSYGKEAKEYALGLTFSQRFNGAFGQLYRFGSKLTEALEAPSLYVVGDVYLSRGLRLVNIIFCLTGVFAFLRFLEVKRIWALIGVASLLFIMDLQKVGVTLKEDSVLAVFELFALMFFVVALLSYLPQYPLLKCKRASLLLMAVAFSALASATRLSGLYICVLVTATAFLTGLTMEVSRSKKITYFLTLCGILGACWIAYLFNIYDFGNPLFPFNAPWPFHKGYYVQSLQEWQNRFNINWFPPILNEIYLLIHSALGVSVIAHKLGIQLPGPVYLAYVVRWLPPALLVIFIVPLFWRRRPVVKILSIIFIYWFTLWSLGAHYTRLFIAGSSVCIFLAVIMAGLDKKILTVFQRRLQLGIQILLIGSLGIFVPLHVREAFSSPHDWHSLFGQRARYEAMLNRFNGTMDPSFIVNPLPTFEEARLISGLLKKLHSPVVQTEGTRGLHIYFSAGHFTETAGPQGEFKLHGKADCYLGFNRLSSLNAGRSEELIQATFPQKIFDNGGFFIRCRQ